MDKRLRVLFVEDSEDDTLLLLQEIRRGGFAPVHERVDTAAALLRAISEQSWDLIISDYRMPNFTAPAALEIVKAHGLHIPFIIVSGKVGEGLAVAAMKAGAHDYLMKGNLSRLVPAIERELREAAEREKHRRAEEAIRLGKMEWEAVFDAVSDLIILTDLNGTIIRCNERVVTYFTTDYRHLLGRKITALFYGPQAPDHQAFRLDGSIHDDLDADVAFPLLRGWFNVASYPMRMEGGELHGVVHIVKDITSRRRAEEEKKVSDRELLTLYAIAFRLNSKSGLKKILADLLFQLHNMLQIDVSCIHLLQGGMLELKAERGFPRGVSGAMRTLPLDLPWVGQVLAGKPFRAVRETADVITAASRLGQLAWCAVPLTIGAEVLGMLTVAQRCQREYSDRELFLLNSIANQLAVLVENHTLYEQMRVKAEELQRANIELGQLNAVKNTFIGMASHELKTPITSILGGVQLLLHYSNLQMTPEQREMLGSVYESAGQLRNLMEDMLSLSRLEADGITLYKRPLNLLALSREAYETFTLPLLKRQITVEIAEDDQLVSVDEGFFRLVARNLLENAIKFTPDGGEIKVAGRRCDSATVMTWENVLRPFYPGFPQQISGVAAWYRLDVVDSGIGIPPEERPRVFEKFYGVGDIAYHTSGKTDFMSQGSGLGLSLVRGVMDAHRGLVWVTAGPGGRGSVFSLLFPMEWQAVNGE